MGRHGSVKHQPEPPCQASSGPDSHRSPGVLVAQFAWDIPDEDVDRRRPGGVSRERLDPGPARADRGPEDAPRRVVRHRVRPGRSVQARRGRGTARYGPGGPELRFSTQRVPIGPIDTDPSESAGRLVAGGSGERRRLWAAHAVRPVRGCGYGRTTHRRVASRPRRRIGTVPDCTLGPDDPSRALIRQVLGAVAGYERNMIALRMRRGRARKAHQGGYAYGAPPFGLQATDRELVEHPVERETTARIVELRETGASLRSIVDTLAAEGRPAKRGGTWHPRTVAAVVRTAQLADRP